MTDYQSLSHTKWECKYHVVFLPKYRRKVLYGHLRPHLGEVFRELARHKESTIEEGHLQPDQQTVRAVGDVQEVATLGGSGFDRPGHLGWLRRDNK